MRRDEPAAQTCPVCGLPADGQRSCEECRWPLRDRPRPDRSDPEGLRIYTKDLDQARRAFDAVAAARAGTDRFRFAAYIRGGVPDEVEWAEARRIAASAMVSPTPLRWFLSQGLDRRDGAGLAVVEVDAEGVRVTSVRVDELGVPYPAKAGEEVSWPVLLPMLSRNPEERRFQLAGGLAGLDRERLWAEVEHRTGQVVPLPGEVPVVLVCRAPGWPIPERVVDALRRLRPDADLVRTAGERAADLLGQVIAESPLRRAYRLVAADVDLDGRVLLRTLPLFAAGERAGREAERWVRRAPGGAAEVALAVVAMAGDGSPALLSVHSARLRPGRNRIRAVLEAPGRVRFTEPAGVAPEPRDWPELVERVPARLTGLTAPVDLLCGVELGGPPEQVRRRMRLVRELIEAAERESPGSDDLRVAILGYGDHSFLARAEHRRVVRRTGLLPAVQALRSLATLRPVDDPDEERRYAGDAAPVEDMLHEAVALLGGPAAGRRRILLTVGGRPPHPVRAAEEAALPCPLGRDWRVLVRRLRTELRTACVAVPDRPRRAGAAWRELGAAGLWELSAADPHRLAADLGLLPAHPHELPFPLVDEERGI